MKQLGKLLKTDATSGLDALLQQARDMDDLAQKLRSGLGPPLAGELRAVNLREGGELVVVCTSSGWAARMRFETETLLRLARQAGVPASACRIRVSHD